MINNWIVVVVSCEQYDGLVPTDKVYRNNLAILTCDAAANKYLFKNEDDR